MSREQLNFDTNMQVFRRREWISSASVVTDRGYMFVEENSPVTGSDVDGAVTPSKMLITTPTTIPRREGPRLGGGIIMSSDNGAGTLEAAAANSANRTTSPGVGGDSKKTENFSSILSVSSTLQSHRQLYHKRSSSDRYNYDGSSIISSSSVTTTGSTRRASHTRSDATAAGERIDRKDRDAEIMREYRRMVEQYEVK
jgi:hypothetical protein